MDNHGDTSDDQIINRINNGHNSLLLLEIWDRLEKLKYRKGTQITQNDRIINV